MREDTTLIRKQSYTLHLTSDIAGVQIEEAKLISKTEGNDIVMSANGITIIFNMTGTLETSKLTFDREPTNFLAGTLDERVIASGKFSKDIKRAIRKTKKPDQSIEAASLSTGDNDIERAIK